MTLLHQFCHSTYSIYWLVTIYLGKYPIINIRDCFLNALLVHSRIVIIVFHSCNITTCQAKNSKTRRNYIEKYIAPLPWLIIMNVPNWFCEFVIGRNNYFSRQYSGLKNFTHLQSLCIPMKYPSILVSFPLNRPMFLLWNLWDLDLNMEWGLWYILEVKIF